MRGGIYTSCIYVINFGVFSFEFDLFCFSSRVLTTRDGRAIAPPCLSELLVLYLLLVVYRFVFSSIISISDSGYKVSSFLSLRRLASKTGSAEGGI